LLQAKQGRRPVDGGLRNRMGRMQQQGPVAGGVHEDQFVAHTRQRRSDVMGNAAEFRQRRRPVPGAEQAFVGNCHALAGNGHAAAMAEPLDDALGGDKKQRHPGDQAGAEDHCGQRVMRHRFPYLMAGERQDQPDRDDDHTEHGYQQQKNEHRACTGRPVLGMERQAAERRCRHNIRRCSLRHGATPMGDFVARRGTVNGEAYGGLNGLAGVGRPVGA